MGNEYVRIDTDIIDKAVSQREELVRQYAAINTEYDRIIAALLAQWKGKGADAFRRDAGTVKTNITGIYDILKIMCDTLQDCKDIIAEADHAVGEYNQESANQGSGG